MAMLVEIGNKDTHPLVLPIVEPFNGTLDIPLPQTGFHCIDPLLGATGSGLDLWK